MRFFIVGLLLALAVAFTTTTLTCKKDSSKSGSLISITVKINNKYLNSSNSNKLRIYSRDGNGSAGGDAKGPNIILSRQCFKIKRGSQLDKRTEKILSYFQCIARKHPKMDILWKKSDDPGWTQAVGQTVYGWDPFQNTFGVGCHLLGLFGGNIENIRVTCGYKDDDTGGGGGDHVGNQNTHLRMDVLGKEKGIEVSYELQQGKEKSLQFFENEESGTQQVSITQCDLTANGPEGTRNDKSKHASQATLKSSVRLVIVVVLVLMALMTGIHINSCVVKWRLQHDNMMQARVATTTTTTRRIADALPMPRPTTLSLLGRRREEEMSSGRQRETFL